MWQRKKNKVLLWIFWMNTDILDEYLTVANNNTEKEKSTRKLIQELVSANKHKGVGLGNTMVLNLFNLAALMGLLASGYGLKRSMQGWVNNKASYEKVLKEKKCEEPKHQLSLLKQLANKLGYAGDTKVAEHSLCKTFRKDEKCDIYFEGQSLFDIRANRTGTAHSVAMVEQKWGTEEWLEMNVTPPPPLVSKNDEEMKFVGLCLAVVVAVVVVQLVGTVY